MSEDDKKTMYEFWLSPSISRPTGNNKDIKRVRLGPKIYSSHMIHVLNKSQTEAFLEFRTTHPDIKITQRKFENLKPYFVRAARQQDRSTCCCRYHVEARSIFKKCMEFRKNVLTNPNFDFGDTNQIQVFETLSDLIDTTLCIKESQEANYKMNCLDRNCNNCGIHCLILMQEELDNSELAPDVKWERYEYVNVKTKGSSRRKLMLINKTTKPGEMFNYFKYILKSFPSHQFRANWQNKQFQMLKENLTQQHCIVVHDFSENYRCFDKTEIQSSYFARLEISIHVTLIYRHAILEIDGEERTDENPSIVTEQLFVFSPDDSHDMYFTHDVRKLVANYLSSISASVTTIHEFTDGCQAQYKSRHCLGDFSYSREDFGFQEYFRNFFETSHAKGPQDAAGGFVKRQADIAVLRGKINIKTAEDLYHFAIQNLTKPNETANCKRRIFRLLNTIERDEPKRFKPVTDNRSIHRVHCVENGIISVNRLSCYSCDSCLNGNYSNCQNCHITEMERRITMTKEDEPNRETDFEAENETEIKDLVNRGRIVAVIADDPNDDYFLLKASGKAQILNVDSSDKWGAHFRKGSEIIRGLYFDKLTVENGAIKFKLLQRKTALVPAVSTRFICLDLDTSDEGILTMPEDTHLAIIDSL